MFKYEFMQNALYAILIITPLFGIVGTAIVNNKMAFFSDALGHSALTGIAIGALLGISNPSISMIIFGIIFGLLLNKIKDLKITSKDTIISVFSSTALAIGLVILSKNGNFSKFSNYLIGDILSISKMEILYLLCLAIVIIAFWILFSNKLYAVSLNSSLAKSKGVKVNLIENLFIVLVALIVMLSIRWVGILIINSLLILPAAASRNIAKNMRQYHLFAILFALFSGIIGLLLSYFAGIATGPTIVIIASVIFFVTYFVRLKMGD
ncbi:MAG: metal ABC transporter permease [Clostridia bacterium]|nr:metal ABC transporter permease [Clostridia bacterium]